MNLHITERAYAGYRVGLADSRLEGDASADIDALQARLQTSADRGAAAVVQWQGSPAMYVLDAYWRYETREEAIALTECLAVIRSLKAPLRWSRAMRPSRRQA
ncbi:hypothetical protein [Paenibacillus sp.]|uniref:hypothetical protein n=1 Tax=Paenibacillus sp. TaxID=58172 RepID=UPI002D52E8D5|nr:hypothetical protein [Paenibacillus sp.]HZG57010.1 hypothetical protein [Paenibacillus sp.]